MIRAVAPSRTAASAAAGRDAAGKQRLDGFCRAPGERPFLPHVRPLRRGLRSVDHDNAGNGQPDAKSNCRPTGQADCASLCAEAVIMLAHDATSITNAFAARQIVTLMTPLRALLKLGLRAQPALRRAIKTSPRTARDH
jgi:hypothetical protein